MKILHAADFHLDAPFSALSPEKGAIRREEGRKLLDRMAALAREEQVDLVLLAGDLFDGQTVYRETLTALTQALGSIPAPVFIAPGNHDPYSLTSPYETLVWPDNVTIFTGEAMAAHPLPHLNCTVYGAAFCHAQVTTDPLAGFSAPHDDLLHIGVIHGDMGQGNSLYRPVAEGGVAASRLDYLALGHIHAPSGLQKIGQTHWAYPGCPEGRGFDELGERGCLLVSVEKAGVSAQFCPLSARKYLELAVDITDQPDPLATVEAVLVAQDPKDCLKVLLTGQTNFNLSPEALERKFAPLCFALRVRDHTRPAIDLEKRAGEDTLTGAFLREIGASDQPGVELALRFGLAALERGEDCRP